MGNLEISLKLLIQNFSLEWSVIRKKKGRSENERGRQRRRRLTVQKEVGKGGVSVSSEKKKEFLQDVSASHPLVVVSMCDARRTCVGEFLVI